MSDAPPPVIDFSRVIAYAIVDSSVEWTGRKCLYVGDELLGAVPRLAICQNVGGQPTDILLLHCDENWESLGCSGAQTIDEVKSQAERAYRGISSKWIETGVTPDEAERWIREHHREMVCSFCGQLPTDSMERWIEGKNASICGACVRRLYAVLERASDQAT